MLNRIDLNSNNISLVLMKNRREELYDVDVEYIKEIVFNLQEKCEMSLEIPSHINHNGEKFELPLYDMIKGKRQLVLTVNDKKYKFIIGDVSVVEQKEYSIKTVPCIEFQDKLTGIDFIIGDAVMTRQLYRDENENVEVADGVLNLFEQYCTGWKVNHVDQKAKQELIMCYDSVLVELYSNHTINNVELDTVLFDKQQSVDIGDKPLNMTISWKFETYGSDDKQYMKTTQSHDFKNLPYPVKNIQARYTSTDKNFYGIIYTITYVNDTTQEFEYQFVNCRGLRVVVENISLTYETGEISENWTTKYRSFDTQTCSWTSMLQQIEEAYDCIITFDSYNQFINVYDKDSMGIDTGLTLTYDNGINKINKTYSTSEIVSKLNVESSNVDIASVNPLGTTYLENYNYYIDNDIMSDELKDSMIKYKQLIEEKDIEFKTISLNKTKLDQTLTLKNSQLKSLEEQLIAEQAILSAFIKANDTSRQAKQQEIVVGIQNQISDLLREVQELKDKINEFQSQMVQIGIDINRQNATLNDEKLFNDELLLELSDYTFEKTITDDNYLTSYALYSYAEKTLDELQKPSITFDIDTYMEFLNRIVNVDGFSDYVYTGAKYELVNAEDLSDDGLVMLYSFKYSPKDNKLSDFKFTNNKKEPETAMRKLSNTSKTANSTKSLTDFYKATLNDAKNNMVDVNKILTDGLDLSANIIRQRKGNNLIEMTEAGIYLIDAEDDNNQLALINNLICMTTDRWRTSAVAISPNGVVADTLIGKFILGENLFIGNGDNTFKIVPNGLYIYDDSSAHEERIFLGIEQVNGVNMARLRLHSATGDKSLVLSEEGIYQVSQLSDRDSFDFYNPFDSYFYIPSTLKNIFEARMIVHIQPFRSYSKSSASTKIPLTTTGGSGNIPVNISGVSGSAGGTSVTSSGTSVAWGHGGKHTGIAVGLGEQNNPTLLEHTHWINLLHDHSVTTTSSPHSHNINLLGSANADSHTHDIEMPSHTHEHVYGIYETNYYPDVEVYVGEVKVTTLNESNTSVDINITERFKQLASGSHKIRIKTPTKSHLGRASFTLFWGGFYSYD